MIINSEIDYGSDNGLKCPVCGDDFLHHGKTTVYERLEDEAETHVTTIGYKDILSKVVKSKGCGNPSSRRNGITIGIWCESCDFSGSLMIWQHKGKTFIEWSEIE